MTNIFDQFDDDDIDELKPGAAPGLAERFTLNFDAGYRYNTLLGAAKDASTESRRDDRTRFDAAYEAFPEWTGFLEGAAAFGGQVAGTASSVENFLPIGLGGKIVAAGKTGLTGLWARVFAGSVDAAAVNAVTDTAIQGVELEAGFREDFDPLQLGASVLLGAGIGGGGAAVGRGIKRIADRSKAGDAALSAANPFDAFDEAPTQRQAQADVTSRIDPEAPAAEALPDDLPQAKAPAEDPAPARPMEPSTARAIGDDLSDQAVLARTEGADLVVRSERTPDAETPAKAAGVDEPLPQARTEPPARTAGQDFLQAEPQALAPKVATGGRRRPRAGTKATAAPDPSAEPVKRLRETAEELARQLGVAATRQGRMGNRPQALGLFFGRTGAVRVRSLDDFDTISHEYGHHLDARIPEVKGWIKARSKDLAPLDYDQVAKRDFEGFAEFFRLWLTNRPYVEKTFPDLALEFYNILDRNPKIRDGIDAATEAYDAFLTAPSTVAVASTIVSAKQKGWAASATKEMREQGIAGSISDVLGRLYTFFFDDLNPLQQSVRYLSDLHFENTGKKLQLNVSNDAYKLARMSRGSFSAGHMDVMYGVAPYQGLNPATPSLRDAIVEATGKPNGLSGWDDAKVQEFGSYLWSRRALGEWGRFRKGEIPRPPDKLTEGDHKLNVKELEAANPQYRSAAEKIYAWNLALWTKKRDAGLIDQKTWREGLEIVDYVPGLRDFTSATDEKMPAGKPRKAKDLKYGVSRRFKGSKRDVINPLESLAADAYETAMTIARNDVIKALDRLGRTAGLGSAKIVERIPTHEIRANMVDPLEAVESAARAAGLSGPDIMILRDAVESAVGDEKAAIFRPAMINDKGEPIVFFRDGGKLTALRLADGAFGRDMYRALTSMSQQERNFWVELVAMPARLLRLGITTSFDFIGANFLRDQTMAWVYYGKPLQRVAASLRGAADDILGTEAARAYSRVSGITGGQETASLGKVRVERDISRLARKGWVAQRLTSFRGALETVEIAETASRMGLFRTFFDEAKGRGLAEMEAALEASWRSRDYLDFDRRGSGMNALARVIPFLNAALQGTDKTARHMIGPLARKALGKPMLAGDERAMGDAVKAWARLAALSVGSMSLYALQRSHEDHDEISDYTKSTHWTIKVGEKWLAIPKPFELGAVINLAESTFDAMIEKDPTALSRWLDNLHFTLMPPSILEGNPAIKSYFELRTNTDLFTGGDIVPEHMTGMEPWLQYTARSSALSRQLGEAFGMSPEVIDHLIMNHLASWGRSALAMYDLAQPDAPTPGWDDVPILRRFIKDAAKGSQSVTRFWDLMGTKSGQLEGKVRSYKALSPAERADYFARQNDQAKVYIALATMDAPVRRLHPLQRARRAVQAIGILRREMAGGNLRNAFGEPQSVASAARSAADDILGTLAMAISRNALVSVEEPGWAQREPIDEDGFYHELEAVDPGLLETLGALYAEKKVWRHEAVEKAWPELRDRLLADGSAALVNDLVADVEASGLQIGDGLKRPGASGIEVDPGG